MNAEQLIEYAREARKNAFAPYSRFKVGAALRAASGKLYTGCNIENATYGLTVCAERVALWKAISEGERAFTQIAVISASRRPASPCGACRQLLWEFCGDIEVVLANLRAHREVHRLADLLPRPFDRRRLVERGSG
jgi:cytidine deaminase